MTSSHWQVVSTLMEMLPTAVKAALNQGYSKELLAVQYDRNMPAQEQTHAAVG